MEIGIGLGITRFPGWGVMNIGQLFASGEQGAWYDPSDMSTLFQDSAGTTPVTAVEQPVGRILDKSGRGNHATQATTTKRPVLSRRVNLLTESEFRNGVTDAYPRGGLVSASALSGYLGAIAFGYPADSYAYKSFSVTVGTAYVISVVLEMDDGLPPSFLSPTIHNSANDFALILAGAGAGDPRSYAVQALGGARYRVSSVFSPASNASVNCGVIKYTSNSSRTFKVTAYDLRLAIDAHLPYQRVNTDTDYDADPAKYPAYLRFDGVDDAMVTGNIDFTGTDKMTVWAGVTKLSDASSAVIAELGVSLPSGGFYLAGPNLPGANFGFASKGTAQSTANATGQAAPIAAVLACSSDIAGDIASLRVNGVTTTVNTDQGAGNYGNYPLYIGARAGTLYFFNGRLYSLIVLGAQSSLSQIEAAERYIKQKMRLP